MSKAEATPWRAWIHAAATLGITPRTFWRLSLREWRALMFVAPSHTLGRTELDALARTFPDKT